MIDLSVLDHLIITSEGYYYFVDECHVRPMMNSGRLIFSSSFIIKDQDVMVSNTQSFRQRPEKPYASSLSNLVTLASS